MASSVAPQGDVCPELAWTSLLAYRPNSEVEDVSGQSIPARLDERIPITSAYPTLWRLTREFALAPTGSFYVVTVGAVANRAHLGTEYPPAVHVRGGRITVHRSELR